MAETRRSLPTEGGHPPLCEAAQATGVMPGDDLPLLARWLVTTLDGVMLLYTVDRDADRAIAVLDAFVDALTSCITT